MRLLWLTENYPPRRGGMSQACDRIVHNLRQAGIIIDVVFFSCAANELHQIDRQNGREIIAPIGDSPGHDLNCLYNLFTQPGCKVDYTHLIAFGGNLPVVALPVFKAWLGCHALTLLRGNDFDLGIFIPQRRLALSDAVRASDAVCVLSSELRDRVAAIYPQADVKLVPNGIDLEQWHSEPFDLEQARAWRQANGSQGLLLGLIGQFKAKKGGLFLLENVIKAGLGNAFHFMIVGDIEAPMQTWLEEHAETLTVSKFPFTDRFELMSRYLACDYIALPSHYDGMPNVLLEAGALAIPVIAARTAGIAEVLPEAMLPLTFHPGDGLGCQQVLYNATRQSSEQRQAAGKALQEKIAGNFTAARETAAYLEILKNIPERK